MTKPISDNQKQFFEKHGWETEGVTCSEAFRKMEEFFNRMRVNRNFQKYQEETSRKAHLKYIEKKKLQRET